MVTDDADGNHGTEHDDSHGSDHGHERPAFDPEHVALPSRAPPLRSTAPQSAYITDQVLQGLGIALIGMGLVFGLPLLFV